ncbi:YhhN-like protein [Corynebacterium comes]|uniref:YhhN-like protein n=2 Tax=Corynebacterium comes TaxID=2675218 RepID=A0A6B8VV90_9CORY|nr:YhhN-like protein [Corynebacterium comes]
MVKHTRDGVDALLASVNISRQEPERLAYLGLGELVAWSQVFRWRKVRNTATPFLHPLLAATILRTNREPVLLAGMAGGLMGNVVKLKRPDQTPVLGMFGIAANHAAYSSALIAHGARPSTVRVGLRTAAWVTGIGLAVWKKKQLIAPAVVAGVFVSATSALADDPALRDGSTPAKGLGHAGNLLLVSEGIALLRETVLTGDTLGHRILDAKMTVAAVIGHALMVDGLTRR